MRTLLLSLVLVASASAQEGPMLAVWVETPIPHWSCPAYREVYTRNSKPPDVPPCVHVIPKSAFLGYDPDRQEKISWTWALPLNERGRLHVTYKDGFMKMPGCRVDDLDDSKDPIFFEDENIHGLTLIGKPKHIVLMTCSGLIARKP
jgi:hypothetical protein